SVLGPGELHVFAEHLEQGLVDGHEHLARLAVDIECQDDPLDLARDLIPHGSSISLTALAHSQRSGTTTSARLDSGFGSSGWTRIARIPNASAGPTSFSSRFPITTHLSARTPAHCIAI